MAKKTTKVKSNPEKSSEDTLDADKRLSRDKKWVERAQKCRKDWEEKFNVKVGEQYLLGQQWENEGDKDLTVVINHFAASIETDLPNLFYQSPKWFVRPTIRSSPQVELQARVAEAALEAVANQDQNLKKAGKLAVLQGYFRLGCVETIYDPVMIDNPEAGQPVNQTGADGKAAVYPAFLPAPPPVVDPMTGMPQPPPPPVPHPMAGQPIPLMGPDGKPQLQPDKIYSDDQFRFEWVDAALLLLDPDGGPDQSKWRMIGKEVVMPLDEAKENPQFKAWKSRLVATEWAARRQHDQPPEREPGDRERYTDGFVRLYVLYDIEDRRIRVIADAQPEDDYLMEEDFQPGMETHPFGLLSYMPILGPDPSPWPKPPVYDWIQLQKDYNTARFLVQEHAKRNLPKEVYDDETFKDETEITKYTSGGTGVLAKVNSTKSPPLPVQKPGMNDALIRWVPLQQGDWRIVTGQTGARMAAPESGTATEASFAERAGNLRDSQKQDAINDWLSALGWKMLKLIRKNMTFKFWVKLRGYTNQDVGQWLQQRGIQPAMVQAVPGVYDMILQLLGESKWDEVTQEDLDFDAEVSVVPGTARARNLELERQQWVQFLGIIGQAPQLLMSRELIKATAEKFETINERMVDELYALSQKMLAAKSQVAGHPGAGDNGGGAQPGPPPPAAVGGHTAPTALLAAGLGGRMPGGMG
jgi:hypothetical protein